MHGVFLRLTDLKKIAPSESRTFVWSKHSLKNISAVTAVNETSYSYYVESKGGGAENCPSSKPWFQKPTSEKFRSAP